MAMHFPPCHIVWLRRDLRLHDHAALHHALTGSLPVQPVFIFDTGILAAFPCRDDRRLSFIAATLCRMEAQLQQRGGGLLVLRGKPQEIYPALVTALQAQALAAAEDYEPDARRRDAEIGRLLAGCDVRFVKDNVVVGPEDVLREGQPYKVFTPYSKGWRGAVDARQLAKLPIQDSGRYADAGAARRAAQAAGLEVLDAHSPKAMLEAAGYHYRDDALWTVDGAQARLAAFIRQRAKSYADKRDLMATDGTSRLSPYLRFGLVSARECAKAGIEAGADAWVKELIWREFYAMILFHFPESAQMEWNPRYRGVLGWAHSPRHLEAWKEGRTGYPVVDAAMRQLRQDGWMHNRARMIVASFLTKHLRMDWRLGEVHFSQWLMDYDLASNVGGWQWAASTGTDAQPYFRVFNPVLQSRKFDPRGEYIRRYVPELKNAPDAALHAPWEAPLAAPYIPPLVRHEEARRAALDMFKQAAGE